jgi:copper(I)-binding protein
VVVALACCTLTGCAADFGAQTNQPYQPGVGTDDRSGTVFVLNALVVANTNGDGTLVGTLINEAKSNDALVSVTAHDAKGAQITTTQLPQPIPLDSQIAVKLQTGGQVRLTGNGVQLGSFVTVTFSFQQAAPISVEVPIVPNGPIYKGIPVGPTASPLTSSSPTSTAP